MIKRFGILVGAGCLMNIPAVFLHGRASSGSIVYDVLSAMAGALGMGVISILFGSLALVAGRDKAGGGLQPALFITAAVSAFIFYTQYRLIGRI